MAIVINIEGSKPGKGLVPTIRAYAPEGSTVTCAGQEKVVGAAGYVDFVVSADPRSILPEGVQGLTHIQNDGTAWIETGVHPDGDLRVESKFDYISGAMLFGAYDTRVGYNAFGIQPNNSSSQNIFYYANSFRRPSINPKGIHEYDMNKNVVFVDGVQVAASTYNAFTSQYTMALFAFNDGVNKAQWKGVSACYYWKASLMGRMLRSLYPCRYNNQLGMWDIVTNSFFGNQGTGSFIAGEPKEWLDYPTYTVTVNGTSKSVMVDKTALFSISF